MLKYFVSHCNIKLEFFRNVRVIDHPNNISWLNIRPLMVRFCCDAVGIVHDFIIFLFLDYNIINIIDRQQV